MEVLYVGWNCIGDDGIATIAKTLENSKITELGVSNCRITLNGVKALAKALSTNQSVTKLWLKQNPITTEGARLITEAAVLNKTYLQIYINDEYKKDNKVKSNLSILDKRKKARKRLLCILNISCNYTNRSLNKLLEMKAMTQGILQEYYSCSLYLY